MAITAILGLGMGVYGAVQSGKAKREAESQQQAAEARRMAIEANRQDPIDPYRDITNPYANIQIASRAAEMQAEQADIALASTLDMLRATGASAGGATALARAAAQSQRGVAASIEQQEVQNARLRAQGEAQTQKMRAEGRAFKYKATEAREMQELNRQASLESSYSQQAAAFKGQQQQACGQVAGSAASLGLEALQGTFDSAARTQWKDLTSAERASYQDIGGFKGFKTAYQGLGEGVTYDWSKGIDWIHDAFGRNPGLSKWNPYNKPVMPIGGIGQENKIIPVGSSIPEMKLLSRPQKALTLDQALARAQITNLNLGGTSSMYHSDNPYQTYFPKY